MKKRMRRAQLVAETVAVLCPFCGEAQPNRREGSEMWTPEDFKGCNTITACVSCGETLMISHDPKVQFPAPATTQREQEVQP